MGKLTLGFSVGFVCGAVAVPTAVILIIDNAETLERGLRRAAEIVGKVSDDEQDDVKEEPDKPVPFSPPTEMPTA